MSNILIGNYIIPRDLIETYHSLDNETETIKRSFNYLIEVASEKKINDIVCCLVDYSQFRNSHISKIFGEQNLKIYKKNRKPFKFQNKNYKVNLYFETERTLPKSEFEYGNSLIFIPYVSPRSLKRIENNSLILENLYFLEFYENYLRSSLNLTDYEVIKI